MKHKTDWAFYQHMWQTDEGLRCCSLAVKGLFAEVLFVMHKAAPYGCLTLSNGLPLDATRLSHLVGTSKRALYRLIAELEEAGVVGRHPWPPLFSIQMKKHYG